MPSKTKSQLMAENAALRAHLAELEDRLASLSSTQGGEPPGSDVPGRTRVVDALKISEVRYRRLFEAAKDGILIPDANTGRITDANPFLLDFLGYSRTELVGKMLWEIGPFRDIAANRSAFRKLQRNEYIRYENLPLETKEHRHRQVEFISNVCREDGTKVIQCSIRDITARRQAEEALKQAKENLERQNRELRRLDGAKDAIIRDVSHELKTPVAKTAMQLEVLKERLEKAGFLEEMENILGVMKAGILQAPPGTALHRRLREAGRLLERMSGDNADGSTNIKPMMSLKTLQEGYRDVLERLYSPREFYRRVRIFLRGYNPPRIKSPRGLRTFGGRPWHWPGPASAWGSSGGSAFSTGNSFSGPWCGARGHSPLPSPWRSTGITSGGSADSTRGRRAANR